MIGVSNLDVIFTVVRFYFRQQQRQGDFVFFIKALRLYFEAIHNAQLRNSFLLIKEVCVDTKFYYTR